MLSTIQVLNGKELKAGKVRRPAAHNNSVAFGRKATDCNPPYRITYLIFHPRGLPFVHLNYLIMNGISRFLSLAMALMAFASLSHLLVANEHAGNGEFIVSDFTEFSLPPESYWNGSDGSGGFHSGLAFFPNDYNQDWAYWNGWSYSNVTDNTTPGWMNQYSAITGGAYDSFGQHPGIYAVAYVAGTTAISFDSPSAHQIAGFFVTNATYTALSMLYGDAYAKQFGGDSGDDPDWFLLSIWGIKDGLPTDTIDFYLADYRFEDNSLNYIVDTWEWVDLSSLDKVDSLALSLSSSDVGDWGMNTPAYFALDMLHVMPDLPPYVANPINDVFLLENAPDHVLDLSHVFSDPDDDDSEIIISLAGNSNTGLVQAAIDGHTLTLSIAHNSTGQAQLVLEALSNGKTVTEQFAVVVAGQQFGYITEVLQYKPAPGQFINKAPWGLPESAQSIIGGINGSLSLGAYGGFVVFRFEDAVYNHPDNPYGVDFIIFGNPLPHWSEPGIVWVMQDENGNGQPDGTWYQLAGSDYFFSNTIHNYDVTYMNPGSDVAEDVPWYDNYGNTGFIKTIGAHEQPHYPKSDLFPEIDPIEYTLSGSRIEGAVDLSYPAMIQSHRRAFGYADNQVRGTAPFHVPDNPYTPEVTNAGGDGFDISWAVDENGNYVDIDKIHFIKVQTGVLANAAWMGEVSTEITGAVTVLPDTDITGVMDLIVIKDIPVEITESTYQLEAFVFNQGRRQTDALILWSTDLEGAFVDENMVLHLSQSGDITLTATLESNQDINATATTVVNLPDNPTGFELVLQKKPTLFPNPAGDHVLISGVKNARIQIFALSGTMLLDQLLKHDDQKIDISHLLSGVYIVHIIENEKTFHSKLLKR